MAKILNIVFSSILLLPSAVRATATCYSRDGTPNSDIPCSSGSDFSMCCGSGSTCYSNGMCGPVNGSGSRALSLGSCTDHTWNSKKCLGICPQGEFNSLAMQAKSLNKYYRAFRPKSGIVYVRQWRILLWYRQWVLFREDIQPGVLGSNRYNCFYRNRHSDSSIRKSASSTTRWGATHRNPDVRKHH
jgi:hypothetical protein